MVHLDENASPELDRFGSIVESIHGSRAATDISVAFEDGDLDIWAMLSIVGDIVCRRRSSGTSTYVNPFSALYPRVKAYAKHQAEVLDLCNLPIIATDLDVLRPSSLRRLKSSHGNCAESRTTRSSSTSLLVYEKEMYRPRTRQRKMKGG